MLSIDGTEQYKLSGSWINPLQSDHPNFGGTRVVLRDPSGNDEVIGTYGPLVTSFVSAYRPIPNPTITYTMYYVSLDGNGNPNSIVPGITPGFGGITPVAQTTGSLNGGRFSTASLNGLTVTGGQLTPNATGGLGVVAGAIQMAGTVNVGTAQAFNALYIKPSASIIGFIGSDPVSGYSGGWFSQIKGGGSGPANAPFYTDGVGNLFLDATLGGGSVSILGGTFELNKNGITTTLDNHTFGGLFVGLEIADDTSGDAFYATPGFIELSNTAPSNSKPRFNVAANGIAGIAKVFDGTGGGGIAGHGEQHVFDGANGNYTLQGIINFNGLTLSSTATLGSITPPAKCAGFLNIQIGGSSFKVQVFNP